MKRIESNSTGEAIVQEELRLLARITEALGQISLKTGSDTPAYDEALVSLRDQIGDAKPEDIGALVEQMTRVAAIAQRYGKGRNLPVNPKSPYFAHMRLEDQRGTRDVMIGKRGYIDRQRKIQIVDWRNAPVSRIYYRYEEGDDYDEEFGGQALEGMIHCRRSLTINDSKLQRIGCPQGVFFVDQDDVWHESPQAGAPVLSGGQGTAARPPKIKRGSRDSKLGGDGARLRADKHLPEIAALIDPPQFELITSPNSGLVVLQGGAGTGKTTVALHRVAYLNFNQPKRFRPDRMLVIAPNTALVRYVKHVLPALGVEGVKALTSADWFQETRKRVMPGRRIRYNEDTPSVVLRFKKHPLVLKLLADYVDEQAKALHEDVRKATKGEGPRDTLLGGWAKLAGEPLTQRILQYRSWLARQDISAVLRQRLESLLRDATRRSRQLLTDWGEVFTDLTRMTAAVEAYAPEAFNEEQLRQVRDWCTRQSDGFDEDLEGEQKQPEIVGADGANDARDDVVGRFDAPDDALLLYLTLLKQGKLRTPRGKVISYEHLAVDEAQDLAVVEIKVLLEATTEHRCITLAGDTAQRLVFDNEFSDWDTLLETLNMPPATSATLELGYRSTTEVMELARDILGDLHQAQVYQATRSGAPVELHRFTDQGQAVAMMGEALRSLVSREPLASVALITRHPAQARAYADALTIAEVPNVRLIQDQEFSFRAGIEVTDVSQVKGLEFDYVMVLDASSANYPATTESRHLLHIATTRAAHQLWLTTNQAPSPILPATL